MTTQRDRLAAVLHDIPPARFVIEKGDRHDPFRLANADALADALLARGVRIVDVETLAALPTHVPAGHEWECVSCNYKNNGYVTDDGRPCALDYDAAIGRDDLYAALEIKQ